MKRQNYRATSVLICNQIELADFLEQNVESISPGFNWSCQPSCIQFYQVVVIFNRFRAGFVPEAGSKHWNWVASWIQWCNGKTSEDDLNRWGINTVERWQWGIGESMGSHCADRSSAGCEPCDRRKVSTELFRGIAPKLFGRGNSWGRSLSVAAPAPRKGRCKPTRHRSNNSPTEKRLFLMPKRNWKNPALSLSFLTGFFGLFRTYHL